jgi:hypothetical protein
MALTTHNLPSERVTNQRCWLQWKDISWCRKAIWKHFLNSVHWKKLFGRSRGSDVLDRLKAQRLIICPLEVLKYNFDELDGAMFLGVERSCEIISSSWSPIKRLWRSCENEGERSSELIIFLLDVIKREFIQADEMMFHGVERPRGNLFSTSWTLKIANCSKSLKRCLM